MLEGFWFSAESLFKVPQKPHLTEDSPLGMTISAPQDSQLKFVKLLESDINNIVLDCKFIYNIEKSKANIPDSELLSVDKAQNDLKLFCSKIVNQKFGYSSLFDNKNSDKTVNENVLKTMIKNDEEFIDLIDQTDMTLCDALTIENLSYKLNIILKNRIEIIG